MKRQDRIEVLKGEAEWNNPGHVFWWRWKAPNGRILATSETYPSARVARKMAGIAAGKLVTGIPCKLVDLTKGEGRKGK